jgi:hypothetical protein
MAQSFDVFGAHSAKFAVPGINSGLGDIVFSRDVIDGRQPRFAQDFYDLTFGKIHFLHSYRNGGLAVVGKFGKYVRNGA